MSVVVRMPRALYQRASDDLTRPHDFAWERVGFLFGRAGGGGGSTLLLMTSYDSVADDCYVQDARVGARINSTAIRAAMQRALTTGEVVLHVHVHDHRGVPGFSWVDERELARLVPSFARVAPNVPHGALVLSRDRGSAMVWMPSAAAPQRTENISVVGYPMALWRDR
jgi:hypothetical protein